MIEKETELNEGGTVWSDRNVRLEICIRNKNASKKSACTIVLLIHPFFIQSSTFASARFQLQMENLVFFSDGFCVKGKDCFQDPEW